MFGLSMAKSVPGVGILALSLEDGTRLGLGRLGDGAI